jgi:hypothetical protein
MFAMFEKLGGYWMHLIFDIPNASPCRLLDRSRDGSGEQSALLPRGSLQRRFGR